VSDPPSLDQPGAEAVDPRPSTRIVEGRLTVGDLDEFLAAVDSIAEATGAVVQAFDADRVVDAAHLRLATRLAARAIARGEAVARDPAVEVLVYAAGRRQIDRALELGVSPGEQPAAVVVADFGDVSDADREPADLEAAVAAVERLLSQGATLGDPDEQAVRDYYDITDRELDATAGGLPAVVRERVALLDVEK
jgi:KEOPS complex subunit Cgi121